MRLLCAVAAPISTDLQRMEEESKGVFLMKKNIRRLAVLTVFVMLLTLIPLGCAAERQMIVTGDNVRVRDAQSGGKVIGKAKAGTIVTYVGPGNGYMYEIRLMLDGVETTGFMYKEYLRDYSGSSGTNAQAGTNTKPNTNNTANPGTTSTSNANAAVRRNNDTVRATITKQTNVRATAAASSRVVGTLKTRTTVSVLGQKGNSVYITTSKMSGYVSAGSLMMNNVRARAATVKGSSYKVYTGSTGNGKVVASAKAKSNITVLHQGDNWSYVKVGNTYGYIANNAYTLNKKS